jgi:Protein of unknown function (DUF2914)
MKRVALVSLVFCLMICLPVSAMALEVAEGVISTQIRDRQPIDTVQSYPADSGRLLCFTRITGAVGDARVFHVWYREDQEMARIELAVKSSNWRTWSSKRLLPEWAGSWRVEVLDGEGTLLQTIPFNLGTRHK